jgi:hypothetical protein
MKERAPFARGSFSKMKRCAKCKTEKPLSEFHKRSARKGGVQSMCKQCTYERWLLKSADPNYRAHHANKCRQRREAFTEDQRREYLDRAAYSARLRRQNMTPDEKQAWALNRKAKNYGTSVDEISNILSQQNQSCAICRTPFKGKCGREVHIDHDHDSGQVRGVLCRLCNPGLGYFRDNVDLMRHAIRYLMRARLFE